MTKEPKPIEIHVGSIYSQQAQRGLVELEVGDRKVLLDPMKAREIGLWLIESAEACETDETLMHVAFQVGLDRESALLLLRAARTFRARRREHHGAEGDR